MNRIVLTLLAWPAFALALPAGAEVLQPSDLFVDFSATARLHLTPVNFLRPAAFVAGRVALGPTLGRMKLRGDRRVRVAGQREHSNLRLILVLENDDTFALRDADGRIFRGHFLRHNRRRLDLLLFPPDGQRFAEATVASAFGFDSVSDRVQIDEDRSRLRAKLDRNGDHVKLRGRVAFVALQDGALVDGGVHLHLSARLDD